MTAQLIQAHYVVASSSELAILYAENIEAGRMPAMANSPASLFALADLHPLGYRPTPLAFLVYTGLATPRFKLLDRPTSGEKL